jgi:hypothetical protein
VALRVIQTAKGSIQPYQTYPGLAEWIAYDFEGFRDKLYTVHPDWKAQGLLDGVVADLDQLAPGLTAQFLSADPEVHLSKEETLAMPFRFNPGSCKPSIRTPAKCFSRGFVSNTVRSSGAADTSLSGAKAGSNAAFSIRRREASETVPQHEQKKKQVARDRERPKAANPSRRLSGLYKPA